MKRPQIVQRIAEMMRRIAPDAQTILYGSEARGEAHIDSDIDLLILLEDNGQPLTKREIEITRHLYEVELDTGIIISPIIMLRKIWENRPFQTPFSINVMNEGIAL